MADIAALGQGAVGFVAAFPHAEIFEIQRTSVGCCGAVRPA